MDNFHDQDQNYLNILHLPMNKIFEMIMAEVFVSDGNEYMVNPFLIAQVKIMNFSNVIETMKPCQPLKKESTQARERKKQEA